MKSQLLRAAARAAFSIVALLALPAAAAAQDIPANCTGFERIAVETEQVTSTHFRLRQEVEITCDTFKFFADEVDVYTDEDRLVATGNVLFTTPDTRISARRLEFDLETKTGVFYDAFGTAKVKPEVGTRSMFGTQEADMHFRGEKLEKLGERKYRLTNGGFTTCLQPTARWEFTSGSVTINVDRYALATNTVFRVKGVPLLYLPIIYYPLDDDSRSTGFLLPTYGASTIHGQTIRNAFFWAINRSMDVTLMHDWFSKTGQAAALEARYVSGPGSRGNITASFVDEKASLTVFPDGTRFEREAARNYQVQGNLVQELPGNFRAGAQIDYFTDLTINQIFAYDARTSRNRQSTIGVNMSGSLAGWQIGAQYDRRELFFPDNTSSLRGGAPRLTVSRAETPIPRLPVYWNVDSEYIGIVDERTTATSVRDRGRTRFDVRPTIRVPLSKLPWLGVTSSASWRYTWWSQSLTENNVQIEDSISRQYFELATQVTGPTFGRVFDTPGLGFAQRWKHVVEPSVSFSRVTEVDREQVYDRIIPGYDATDTIVGGVTSVRYALTNRLYAKKGEGAEARVREIASLVISQSYYTDTLAAARDQRLRTSFTGDSLSNYSPIDLTLRLSPAQSNMFQFSGTYDTQYSAFRQLNASATLRAGEWLDGTASWSQTRLIPGLPGYDRPDRLSHSLNARASVRTPTNKYGATSSFRYDVRSGGFLEKAIEAHYAAQCCGIGVSFMSTAPPSFGNLRTVRDRRFNISFSLAGIGTFSDFFGAFGAGTYR